jgi:hypothetical protein
MTLYLRSFASVERALTGKEQSEERDTDESIILKLTLNISDSGWGSVAPSYELRVP